MTLDAYLAAGKLTEPEFANLIGVNQSTVNRARRGIPSPAVMRKIVKATAGAVTPNDFFGVAA